MSAIRRYGVHAAAAQLGMKVEAYVLNKMRGQRWCWSCARWLAAPLFGRDARQEDGIARRCKPCNAHMAQVRYWNQREVKP